jgi:dihydropteroate synthase
VAEAGIKAGVQIINDISGFRDDPTLIDLGRESNAGMIIMHMLGTPRNMQTGIQYKNFPEDIYDFLAERIQTLEDAGIDPSKIVVDPGIGFGNIFRSLQKPILVGASRKAFLGKILDESVPANRGFGTLATVAVSVMKGASIVRVHEVLPAVQICRVTEAILRERILP